jgi:hypothetical protein
MIRQLAADLRNEHLVTGASGRSPGLPTISDQQVQQHTGAPPIVMQHTQPAFMQAIMQSQQP